MIQKAHWGPAAAASESVEIYYPFDGHGGGNKIGNANIQGFGGATASSGEYSEDGGGAVFGDCHRSGWSYARSYV